MLVRRGNHEIGAVRTYSSSPSSSGASKPLTSGSGSLRYRLMPTVVVSDPPPSAVATILAQATLGL